MAKRLTKKRKRSIRSFFSYISILILLSVLAYGYKYINSYLQDNMATFKLVDIDIQGNTILSRTQVLELCGLPEGETELMQLNPAQVVQNLRRSPYIKAASAVRSLPATMRIVLEERQPLAFIYGRGLNLIDAEGFLMPVPRSNHNWNLPFITGIKDRLGSLGEQTISGNALLGVQILAFTNYLNSPLSEMISEINLDKPANLKLRLTKGGAIVRLDFKNYRENVYLLTQYFQKYLDWEKLTAIEYFDVRFKDQLIIKEKRG